jgi:hypothetical protein
MADDLLPAEYAEKLNEATATAERMQTWARAKGTLLPGTLTPAWIAKAFANIVYGSFGDTDKVVCKDCGFFHGGCMLCDSMAGELATDGHRKKPDGRTCAGIHHTITEQG